MDILSLGGLGLITMSHFISFYYLGSKTVSNYLNFCKIKIGENIMELVSNIPYAELEVWIFWIMNDSVWSFFRVC
jgi:hypothetical protein